MNQVLTFNKSTMNILIAIGILYFCLELIFPTIVWDKDLVQHFWISKGFFKLLKKLKNVKNVEKTAEI